MYKSNEKTIWLVVGFALILVVFGLALVVGLS